MTSTKHLRHRNVQRDGPRLERKIDKSRTKNSDSSSKLVAIASVLVTILLLAGYFRYQMYLREKIKTPLYAPTMLAKDSTSAKSDPERYWGSYRPNTYFGMRTRTQRSPVFGLMWLNQFTQQMPPPIRHWCDQGDRLRRYGWLKHDGVNFGVQEIVDSDFMLTTSFIKRAGGDHGGDWSANITATSTNKERAGLVSLMFYVALDGSGHVEPVISKNGQRINSINGYSPELGHYRLSFPKSTSNSTHKHNYLITHATGLDKLKEAMMNGIRVEAWDKSRRVPYFVLGGRQVPIDVEDGSNFVVFQVTTELPYTLEVMYESGSIYERPNRLQGEVFSSLLAQHVSEFDKKFDEKFDLKSKAFSQSQVDFAKAALSNMVGSVGYFYGASLVQSVYNEEPVNYWKAALYTGVPSRSFFPRGFLWDEGFHNLLISKWDPEISKDILSHWLDLMNTEGWIPREQILGDEARARVPDEFVVQRNTNANPPTLILPLQRLIKSMLDSDKEKDKKFLKAVLPRLQTWFQWYNTTQIGPKRFTYQWRGRDGHTNKELNPKTLTSGLDDYPRASHPTNDEYHVDLRCWMALSAGLIADISKSLGVDGAEYAATHAVLTDNGLLDDLHWSEKKQQYSDYGLHTDKVRLERPKPPANLQPGQRPPNMNMDKVRVVHADPELGFVNAFGYVSLFPFLLKIVEPSSPKLTRILTDMRSEKHIWTDFGLRSLGQTTPLYNRYNSEHDPPYWRGALWINMNYLALGALDFYRKTPGPYRAQADEIYTELRNNVVNNIYSQYMRTGYIWENYNDKTGEGKGCHPFTGWSALVTLIMAEIYD
ncbi:mannosyl-oligosaccharide glucosidase-like [Mya arenaria]|uniref:mannosyl-oligosaccharide glucosidase-like n=1 Tax=Mya arenaria TaxID=6604 RepID=UPI0022E1C1E6|nr:mannosyl-oligosaccharide glucosidase-like [Mya arenaria]